MAFASCWWGIYGWGMSGGSGCSWGGTLALVFAYDLAFVFAFAVSRPSTVTLVASASAPVWGFSFFLYIFANQGLFSTNCHSCGTEKGLSILTDTVVFMSVA